MTRTMPALLGGTPVRTQPFPPHTTMLGAEERAAVLAVLDGGELEGLEPLRAPVVEPRCTHTYYVYGMTFDGAAAGLSRATLAAALRAEGFPVGEGYTTPLYLQPLYQQRLAYTRGCPFTCGHYDGAVSYAPGLCPVTERLSDADLLITEICKYPNRPEDMRDFGRALRKVVEHGPALEQAARR